jgi:ATP-dependent Clp protease ATP-binding subunit ClpA
MRHAVTDRARYVIRAAKSNARKRGSTIATPADLLMGIFSEPKSCSGIVLHNTVGCPVDLQKDFELNKVEEAKEAVADSVPVEMSPDLLECMVKAHDVTDELGFMPYLSTEHLLVGLLRGPDSDAKKFLEGRSLTAETALDEVKHLYGMSTKTAAKDPTAGGESVKDIVVIDMVLPALDPISLMLFVGDLTGGLMKAGFDEVTVLIDG